MAERACPRCKYVTFEKVCPLCGTETSSNWTGLIVVIDPDESDLANELNINSPGRYALKVRK
ncbi:transcription elongation factor subunit Spt4 [Methanosphaera sp. WGK6]|uniref:transcription elongation factor subunit Spt4 n=1 Tax=Methanosphaera sp. WGK6 TaxID=1561964 RepID=UPI00084C3EEC|nr:transcription elongation factor subunit Spt4 [Methanosphaera sp. WGK6]OED29651.1 DNA-directed RNA polymerase subunit E'' [Methanosphaera sp. WGK6]